jgi:hypothetical protein
MFESQETLRAQIETILDGIRGMAHGRYACILEPKGLVFETAEAEPASEWALRRFLEQRAEALFRIPPAMASGAPLDDLFAEWEEDEFFLAFINGRVVIVIACPDAAPLEEQAKRPLKALADRLFRWNAAWRLDERGRGFFLGRAKLDLVVVGGEERGKP